MKPSKHTMTDLKQMQSLPLSDKIKMTERRIQEWIDEFGVDGVYVSFSGGKDSTVLVDIVRNRMGYKEIPLVFVDTGLEYPEIRDFVKGYGDSVIWIRPKMNFRNVIEKYGYPIISKDVAQCLFDVNTQAQKLNIAKRETKLWDRAFNPDSEYGKKYPSYTRAKYDYLNDAPFLVSHRCCDVMKKKPAKCYEKETERKPIIATMACESRLRRTQWLQDGCNAFDVKRPTSKPMSFWTEQDVLHYIKENNLQICSVYGNIVYDNPEQCDRQMSIADYGLMEDDHKLKTTGCDRTGCMFCMFGCSSPDWDNFVRMKQTHPKQYEYIMKPWSDGGLNYKEVVQWLNEHGNMNIKL